MIKNNYGFIFFAVFFTCLGAFFTSFAQNKKAIDSLEVLLTDTKLADTTKAKIYIDLGRLYYAKDLQKAIYLTSQGLDLSKKNNFRYGEASSLHMIGMFQNFKGSNDTSIRFFLKSLQISEQIDNQELIGANISRIADINRIQKNYKKALEMHQKAISILRKTPNKLFLTNALHRAGLLFEDQKEYEQALNHFKEALLLAEEMKNQNQIALCSFYIGEVYFLQQKNEEALPYLEQARAISTKIGNFLILGRTLNRIGQIFLRKNDTQKALDYNHKALEVTKKVNAKTEIKDIYISAYTKIIKN